MRQHKFTDERKIRTLNILRRTPEGKASKMIERNQYRLLKARSQCCMHVHIFYV